MKVICYGEVVIDLIAENRSTILPKVGGAPLNVAVGLRRLGARSLFVSSIGADWFGKLAIEYLDSNGVDHSLALRKSLATRLALIFHDKNNERSFEFSQGLAAENVLPEKELRSACSPGPGVFYYGSFPFAKGNSLNAFEKHVRRMRDAGTVTLFDPNLRLEIFTSPSDAIKKCRRLAAFADVVRLNVEELLHLMRLTNDYRNKKSLIRKAAAALAKNGPRAIFITDGSQGSYFFSAGEIEYCPAFAVDAVDTTGCGDAFTAAVIAEHLCTKKSVPVPDVLLFANAAGALAATKMGGGDSMPTRQSVEEFVKIRESNRGSSDVPRSFTSNHEQNHFSI